MPALNLFPNSRHSPSSGFFASSSLLSASIRASSSSLSHPDGMLRMRFQARKIPPSRNRFFRASTWPLCTPRSRIRRILLCRYSLILSWCVVSGRDFFDPGPDAIAPCSLPSCPARLMISAATLDGRIDRRGREVCCITGTGRGACSAWVIGGTSLFRRQLPRPGPFGFPDGAALDGVLAPPKSGPRGVLLDRPTFAPDRIDPGGDGDPPSLP